MAPLTLWLVDRSRHEQGRGHCQRARYLGYHAGPHGYGWQRKAQSIPAVTGQLVHSPIAEVLEIVRREDRLPADLEVHSAIATGVAEYNKQVDQRGLRLTTDEADLRLRTLEQTTLLAGLVWSWCRTVLPAWLKEWKVVLVEQEYTTVLGCTCGLGDRVGSAEDHDARECQGIGWMTRADFVAQHRLSLTYAYNEVKTTSDASMNWEATWPHKVQLMAGIMGAEDALAAPIDSIYIHALVKGKRTGEYNPEFKNYSGPKYQQTPLVYGYRRPANPPMLAEAWAVSFSYVDDFGKNRKLTKDYDRTGIWELPEGLWRENGALSASDYWTAWIAPTGTLAKSCRVIGPLSRQEWKLEQFVRQLVADESRWKQTLWELYMLSDHHGYDWGSPETERLLDEKIPQARGEACQSYFGDTCPFLQLCDHHDGWQQPELLGYIARRPHHVPERLQAEGRGLLAPEEGLGETPGEDQ